MKNSHDDPLRDALAHLQPAPCSDEARDRALALSLAALRDGMRDHRSSSSDGESHAARTVWWWLAAAAACIVAVSLSLLPRGPAPKTDGLGPVFGQIEALFPNQLDSVIVSAAGVTVNTSDTPTTTYADQRIRLLLSKAGSKTADVEIVTYSGRHVCVKVRGNDLCMTPLLTGDGGVMVVTDTQVLGQDSPLPFPGYRLHMSPMKGEAL